MSLDLNLLRTFVTVAQVKSFSVAGKRLFLTQQAVSSQIRRLEEQFSTRLFARTTRRVDLTPAGDLLLNLAIPLLNDAREILEVVGQFSEPALRRLTIGHTRSCSWQPLPQTVQILKERLPRVQVLTQEMFESDIVSAVLDDVIDFGITRSAVRMAGLTSELLSVEPLLLAMSAQNPLAKDPEVSIVDISDLPVLLWPRHLNPGYTGAILKIWSDAGVEPIVDTSSAGTSMWSRIPPGEGVTVVAQSMRDHLPRGAVGIPITQSAEIVAYLIYRSHSHSDDAANAVEAIQVARRLGAFDPPSI